MKLHLISDIHSEQYAGNTLDAFLESIVQPADIAILAGDIGNHQTYNRALYIFSQNYEKVIYVPGNHEYYRSSFSEFNPVLPLNVELLNPGITKIGDINFIGATLWTDFGGSFACELAAKKYINDFKVIEGFTPNQCANLFHNNLSYIKQALAMFEGQKVVVVTHFSPTREAISPYWKEKGGILNHYFHNDLTALLLDYEVTWLFGHTHDPIQLKVGNSKLYCNPYGYRNENPHYNPLIIEV